jgi:hypothetical protein
MLHQLVLKQRTVRDILAGWKAETAHCTAHRGSRCKGLSLLCGHPAGTQCSTSVARGDSIKGIMRVQHSWLDIECQHQDWSLSIIAQNGDSRSYVEALL